MSSGPETLGGESRKLSSDTAAAGAATAPVALSTSDDSAEPPVTSTSGQTISPASVKRQLPETADVDPEASAQGAAKSDDAEKSRSKRVRPPAPAVKLLPRRYELADPVDMVVLISGMIMELIHYNDNIPLQGGKLTRFHSRTPPRISVGDYLQRITTHATLSPPILLSMVFYIDRLCALYPAFTISSLTVHRFLIVSATVASKGLSDSFWTNKTYARVGGISVSELAMLELDFLWRLKWQIVPQPEDLVIYYENLVKRSDLYALQPETEPSQPPCVENAP
ncbi:cyclin-domain-containing protein [Talaromyces proteolyticus]|uniref:Cyclin-domain-containing protein n=1 Tax=Talaromyces proteolyticus TaxID=1131652 RepID=A0AAD4L284_9EURO|nr:cyclin-domain-containing protein [Talaromyces proteolyticus]KAH8704205.1 cyclin-domain-containing protein [Talaromyces proteolyticus]